MELSKQVCSGKHRRSPAQKAHTRMLASLPRSLRGGGYDAIHKWLVRHFGKATRCDNITAYKHTGRYHWAKRKGLPYAHKRENFWMLCTLCHRQYDQTPQWIRNARAGRTYKRLTTAHKKAISKGMYAFRRTVR